MNSGEIIQNALEAVRKNGEEFYAELVDERSRLDAVHDFSVPPHPTVVVYEDEIVQWGEPEGVPL